MRLMALSNRAKEIRAAVFTSFKDGEAITFYYRLPEKFWLIARQFESRRILQLISAAYVNSRLSALVIVIIRLICDVIYDSFRESTFQ